MAVPQAVTSPCGLLSHHAGERIALEQPFSAKELQYFRTKHDADDSIYDTSSKSFDLERGSAASSAQLGDMAGAGQNQHYQPKQDIITRLEHIREKDMKWVLLMFYMGQTAAIVILVAELIALSQNLEGISLTQRRVPQLHNIIIGAICLAGLLAMTAWLLDRIIRSMWLGKVWQHRRFRGNVLALIELCVMIINLIAFLIPNIYEHACPCCVKVDFVIAWTAFIRWTCWNTLFFILCVVAHNPMPYSGPIYTRRFSRKASPRDRMASILMDPSGYMLPSSFCGASLRALWARQLFIGSMLERSRWPFIILFTLTFTLLWYTRINSCGAVNFVWNGLLSMQVTGDASRNHARLSRAGIVD
ncbi:hypothetical protein WJX84_001265 [Apatococcus fuscideae]|uniref:Uncharacterized protein n=1 Tax=Apatococcus fuscideae TaxID=2026836 RepID=A0AAW1T3E0_9CHLO